MPTLSLKTASIVLLGVFDVRAFAPPALARKGTISETEFLDSEITTVIPSRVVNFELKSIKVSAQSERVQIEVSAPPFIKAADVVCKALRDSPEYPSKITAVGINLHTHYTLDSFEIRDRLGRRLAPIDAWGRWSEQLQKAANFPVDDQRHSGLMSVVMRLPMTEDRVSGWIDAKVEASMRVEKSPEVFIGINDHYDLTGAKESEAESSENPLSLLQIVETRFDASMHRAEDIISSILEQAK